MSSKYPVEPPKVKHDLLVRTKLPADGSGSLLDSMGFETTASLFQSLEREPPIPTDFEKLATVFSYPDGPKPPLGRALMVIGVADRSLSVVRRLLSDQDDGHVLPDFLHKCTIAVHRADGEYGSRVADKYRDSVRTFADFMQRLRKERLVAILGQDKYHRFGILQPVEEGDQGSGDPARDYFSACYFGSARKAKKFLAQRSGSSHTEQAPVSTEANLWQPPGASDEPASSNGQGLWQPPGATDEPASSNGGFWQPPGATDNDFSWQPPSGDEDFGGGGDTYAFGGGSGGAAGEEGGDTFYSEVTGSRKRKVDDDFHADATAAAADTFYSELTRDLGTRADSRLYHMRAFNGWVKATQIQELDPKTKSRSGGGGAPLRVLDLACGKGGDLGKWILHRRGIGNYVGSDVARGSLRDAAIRARKMRQKLKRCTFTCADLGADVPGRLKSEKRQHMQKLLTWSLQDEAENESAPPNFRMLRGGGISLDDKFDVVSIQFAIHYMMSSQKRARRFFQTVSELLEIGGNLICTTIDARVVVEHMMNLGLDLHSGGSSEKPEAVVQVGGGACRLRFAPEIVERIFEQNPDHDKDMFGLEYTFMLVEGSDHAAGVGDAVNLPEWLAPIPMLESLAKEAGLDMEYAQNFHEFYSARSDPNAHSSAHSSLYNMKVLNRHGSISDEEWEISRLYAALKFRKVRESTIAIDEDGSDAEEDDGDDEAEIDPAVKMKLTAMAMMKAKKTAGEDVWNSLSSQEKTDLMEIEIRKLAAK